MTGELRIIDRSGDTKVIWNADAPAEVEAARKTFENLRKKGYYAYSVKRDGSKNSVITDFDPEAEKIILAPPMSGG